MLATVTAAYFCCWTLSVFYYGLSYVGLKADFTSDFYHFTTMLVYVNSIVNPFIYMAKYDSFQRAAQILLKRCCPNMPFLVSFKVSNSRM